VLFPAAIVAKAFSILVIAPPLADADRLLAPLLCRSELAILRVATPEAALIALRGVAASLVMVCPGNDTAVVKAILTMVAELRPTTPVLLLRGPDDDVPAGGRGRRFAVLRCPVSPLVLERTIDVALGLSPLLH
jgi:hypothetical protein